MPRRIYLDISRHHQPFSQVPLDADAQEIRIGRNESNTITLQNSPEVSRFHALLLRNPLQGYELVDLNSKTGTRINGQRIKPGLNYAIGFGDEIGIGFYNMVLREEVIPDQPDDLNMPSLNKAETQTVILDSVAIPCLSVSAPGLNRTYVLEHSPVTMGRSPECNLIINEPTISAYHALFRKTPSGWEIEDLGSRNGVYYRGTLIKNKLLADGDVLHISSDITLTFRDRSLPNLVPAAHSTIIQCLRNGVIVVDQNHHVVDLNPAAEQILKKSLKQSRGQSIQGLLAEHPRLLAFYQNYRGEAGSESMTTIFKGEEDQATRYVDASISPLVEENGKLAGHIMMLHDMTRQYQAAQELRKANQVTEELYKALRKEIDTGRRIQQEFLPQKEEIPRHDHWEIATVFRPARDIAGDFYDIFPLPGDCIGLVIGDVSDKGVGSSLFMALCRSLIRVFAEQSAMMDLRVLTETLDPARDPEFNQRFDELTFDSPLKAVSKTHEYIFRNHGTACMFATLFFGVLDPESGRLRYINAGHEAPIILKDGVILNRLQSTGVAVGFPVLEHFVISEVCLHPGEQLIAYTDGITDAKDNQGQRFTEARLLNLVQTEPQPSVEAMLEHIEEALLGHIGSASPFDDITMLGIQYL